MIRSLTSSLLGAAAILISAVVAGAAGHHQATGVLTGLVTDSAGQGAVSGARMMIQGTGLTAYTNADGRYTIADIPSGVVTLVVQRNGYIAEAFAGVRITAGQTTTRNVSLRPATASAFRMIPISPAGPPISTRRAP